MRSSGDNPAHTLDRFRTVVDSTVAPSSDIPAYLGEVLVHGQDIRHPLGIPTAPAAEAVTPVAEFYAARNFTVPSKKTVAGLRLQADDGPFAAGSGPLVTGPTLALVMVMAGRGTYLERLDGPGLSTLRTRMPI
jgi:uncharacterized protein (TIGR03083 family)